MFDTGTSLLTVAPPVYETLLQVLAETGICNVPDPADNSSFAACYCGGDDNMKKFPNLTFYATNVAFNITPQQYLIEPYQFDVRNLVIQVY